LQTWQIQIGKGLAPGLKDQPRTNACHVYPPRSSCTPAELYPRWNLNKSDKKIPELTLTISTHRVKYRLHVGIVNKKNKKKPYIWYG